MPNRTLPQSRGATLDPERSRLAANEIRPKEKQMLKSIDRRLNADVLHALALMGHGDTLVLADTNFPAASTAAGTPYGRLLHLSGLTLGEAAAAVLTLLPLDTLAEPACRMQVDGDAETVLPVQAEAQAAIDAADADAGRIASLARQDFYAAARQAFAVITTGDQRFYGTLILRKGAIAP
jgi:L-fucose mutarotase